jgi:hypothetical protein
MCVHISVAATIDAVRQLKFELLPHPAYSLDLAALGYDMFVSLKEALHGWRFASDEEVKDAVHMWLQSQLKSLFADRIRRLVNCYTICIEKSGIILRNGSLHLSQIVVHEVLFDCASYNVELCVEFE